MTMADTIENEATAATTTGEHSEDSGLQGVVGTFGLRGDLFAAQLVNFLLVLLVLWRFAYRPIMRMLDEREQKIAESVKNAEAIEKRLRDADAEHAKVVGAARVEAQAIIEKAMADTETRKTEMVEAAKREVERVIQKGKQQLDEERLTMLVTARKDLVEIAVKAAAKIVTEGLTEKKSQSMAEEMVRKLT
jgi:F-type H+-transporting ATPase subunit b